MPPLSGKILWARQLLRHIEQIMDLLKVKSSLLQLTQGKAVVRKYNRMALVLTEYEILHYQSWIKIVEVCQRNIQVIMFTIINFFVFRQLQKYSVPEINIIIPIAMCR